MTELSPREIIDGLRAVGLTLLIAASGELILQGEKRLIVAAWSWLAAREAEVVAALDEEALETKAHAAADGQ